MCKIIFSTMCYFACVLAVIVVGSVGWLVFIAMLGVLIYYRRYVGLVPSAGWPSGAVVCLHAALQV